MGAARGDRLANVSGAVLCGGASSRMGSDKARAELGGLAAAARIARLLDALFGEVLLVGGMPPPGAPGRFVPDGDGPQSPLRGLVAALQAASADEVVVVACDLPLVTPDLLLALVAWPPADAVAPRSGGRADPLCALYRREAALPVARARLARGELGLQGLLAELRTAHLEDADLARIDPGRTALTNVNTPEDLARARALLEGQRAGAAKG